MIFKIALLSTAAMATSRAAVIGVKGQRDGNIFSKLTGIYVLPHRQADSRIKLMRFVHWVPIQQFCMSG